MNREIKTKLPHPKDIQLIENLSKYEARSMHGQLPVVWDRAEDFNVYDRWGNKFIDFTSGICVTNTGHGNPDISRAIFETVTQSLLHSYTFPTDIRYNFIKNLVATCYPKGKVFLVSSGTEATEAAVKLMLMNHIKKTGETDGIIVSLTGAMHGRTYVAENLKGETEDNIWALKPSNLKFYDISNTNKTLIDLPSNCIDKIAGFIIESYRGWDAHFYSKQFIFFLMAFAKKYHIPVCFDEIQGGFGRTGKMWAFEHYGLNYNDIDLICFGKGASSSLPLSGVIGKKKLLDIPKIGSMSSTHSANPLSCATGLANLHYLIEHNLIKESERKGIILHKKLQNNKYKIKGHGLLAAIVTENEKQATNIVYKCFKKGLLLILTHKNSVKIAPPLTITEEALKEGVEIIKENL